MTCLVIDVGSTSARASVVSDDGSIEATKALPIRTSRPAPGIVEFDPAELGRAVVDLANWCIGDRGAPDGIGICAQRASTVLWNRRSLAPVGPGISWQDLRTVGQCLTLRSMGIRLAPNQSATKLAWLFDHSDPERTGDLCFGTIESFVAAVISNGSVHATDRSNAAVTGLLRLDASGWDHDICDALKIPEQSLPSLVDSLGVVGHATALTGAPPIAALIGDQQASMIGQGCLDPGQAKATFGTGAMLDCPVGPVRPGFQIRGEQGTFPIVTWSQHATPLWGVEAVMLSAGSCVEWLASGLQIAKDPDAIELLASTVTNAGGVSFVPSLAGMGAPIWDFGARGCLVGLDGSTTAAHIAYAVLEGIAARGADLVEAAEADTDQHFDRLRVDGGMSKNALFIKLLANAIGRPVELSQSIEATTLGAGFLAGVAVGTWSSLHDATRSLTSRGTVEPTSRADRGRWLAAREHARRQVPALSALEF